MSHETVERRAAEIRRHWSKQERQKRSQASDFRCMELVAKLYGMKNAPAGSWGARRPA
jgi:hypothetical protein